MDFNFDANALGIGGNGGGHHKRDRTGSFGGHKRDRTGSFGGGHKRNRTGSLGGHHKRDRTGSLGGGHKRDRTGSNLEEAVKQISRGHKREQTGSINSMQNKTLGFLDLGALDEASDEEDNEMDGDMDSVIYKDFDPDEDEPTHDPAWYVLPL